MNPNEAEAVALNVLNFLVADEIRLGRFMDLSGIDPQSLRRNANEPAFLAGILEYLLQDETLVYAFSSEHDITPDMPARARRVLVGGEAGEYY